MDLLDRLTILIPTYNRKERLLGTLHSIASQGHWGEYNVVIVDNCSNYSVEEAINEEFAEGFSNSVTVHRWFFNTGMSTNISIAFEFVRTKWCWFLSDDDIILDGALDTVLNDMSTHPLDAAIKYSIENICFYDNTSLSTVEEWAHFYLRNNTGDKCYLSMLYNIQILYPYLQELTIHSYSYLSFWIPVLRALNETESKLFMSSSVLYKYKPNNDGWSSSHKRYLDTLLGIRTLFDSDFSLSPSDQKLLRSVYSDMFNCRIVSYKISFLENNFERKKYHRLLRMYYSGNTFEKILYLSYLRCVLLLNISTEKIEVLLKYLGQNRT